MLWLESWGDAVHMEGTPKIVDILPVAFSHDMFHIFFFGKLLTISLDLLSHLSDSGVQVIKFTFDTSNSFLVTGRLSQFRSIELTNILHLALSCQLTYRPNRNWNRFKWASHYLRPSRGPWPPSCPFLRWPLPNLFQSRSGFNLAYQHVHMHHFTLSLSAW